MNSKRPGAVHIQRNKLLGLDQRADLELQALTGVRGVEGSQLIRNLIHEEFERVVTQRFNAESPEPEVKQ
jgi:hypothetical protein